MKNVTGTFLGFKGHCCVAWLAALLHKVLLLPVWLE